MKLFLGLPTNLQKTTKSLKIDENEKQFEPENHTHVGTNRIHKCFHKIMHLNCFSNSIKNKKEHKQRSFIKDRAAHPFMSRLVGCIVTERTNDTDRYF